MADVENEDLSTRQVVLSAVVLGLVCALVVWWLEQFNRERLIADFHKQLEKLPTHFKEGTPDG